MCAQRKKCERLFSTASKVAKFGGRCVLVWWMISFVALARLSGCILKSMLRFINNLYSSLSYHTFTEALWTFNFYSEQGTLTQEIWRFFYRQRCYHKAENITFAYSRKSCCCKLTSSEFIAELSWKHLKDHCWEDEQGKSQNNRLFLVKF